MKADPNLKSPPRDIAELKELIGRRLILLPPKMLCVIKYALENPTDMALSMIGSVARNCEVAESSVSRTVRAVGFEHFKEFRELFRRELRQKKEQLK
jgi:DNA-binding MurR/RpiR family transcriptional regulator